MASKTISWSQVFLATAMILFAIYGKGSEAAHNPFCKKCTPGEQTAQCDLLVKGAKTWEQALTNVINAIQEEVKIAKPIIDNLTSKLPLELLPISKDSLGSTCKEEFESMDDDLQNTLDQIKNGDPQKSIPTELSAVLSYFSDCTDALMEFDVEVPELNSYGEVFRKYASISLAVTQLKYHYT